MPRRFLVPGWALIGVLSLLMLDGRLRAQEKTTQEKTAQDTSQEAAATDAAQPPAKPAADAAPAEPPATVAAKPDPAQARAEFEAKFAEWKDLLKHMRTLKHEYQVADEASRQSMEQQWPTLMAQANDMIPALAGAATKAYEAAPNEDRELTSFLIKLLQDYVLRDRYAEAAAVGGVLVDNKCDMPEIYRETGVANFALHNFDKTKELLDLAEKANALSGDSRMLRDEVENYREYWKKEQEIRAKEAAADDLPRVKLTTTKGDIVVELFENEAPDTVGNFISLVKQGFYNGLTFHRVIAGFMAQVGCPEGDGTGGPGYTIYDECEKPDARMHFRGVLSMAKTNAPNSGGSQFFITFRPTPHLNGIHTVFGRVIEGMDVVDQLQRREPGKEGEPEPDKIIEATVLRDRGHDYLPKKVE